MAVVDYEKLMEPFVLQGVVTPTSQELGRGLHGTTMVKVKYCTDYAAKEVEKELQSFFVDQKQQHEKKTEFLRMSYLLSRCHHPNIVQFIGIYYPKSSKGFPTLVMELMDCTLRSLVERNKTVKQTIPLYRMLSILHDVSLGVWYMHSRKPPIMHCDLIPTNILVNTSSMVAKIAGFGAASEGFKGDVKAPGTPAFMPPEALKDKSHYDLSLDVFSYGGTTLYAIVGEWPVPEPVPSDSIQFASKTEVDRRHQYLKEMKGEAAVLRPLVEECLNNNPARRPAIEVVSKRIKELKNQKDPDSETKVTLNNFRNL